MCSLLVQHQPLEWQTCSQHKKYDNWVPFSCLLALGHTWKSHHWHIPGNKNSPRQPVLFKYASETYQCILQQNLSYFFWVNYSSYSLYSAMPQPFSLASLFCTLKLSANLLWIMKCTALPSVERTQPTGLRIAYSLFFFFFFERKWKKIHCNRKKQPPSQDHSRGQGDAYSLFQVVNLSITQLQ
jgi:hypothetical protein